MLNPALLALRHRGHNVRIYHTVYNRRPPVRFLDDEELAYVAQRSREIHDFWHVLFGCHTNVFGELALKAVEFVQARLSSLRPRCSCLSYYTKT